MQTQKPGRSRLPLLTKAHCLLSRCRLEVSAVFPALQGWEKEEDAQAWHAAFVSAVQAVRNSRPEGTPVRPRSMAQG